jgi:hypothetical protein
MSDIEKEKIIVSENMIKSGGSFCKKLGELIQLSDSVNLVRIKTTFIDYWNKYLEVKK